MMPEFLLLQELGRQILRERGVNPDTAFSGGINDPRLAKVPAAAAVLDSLNTSFVKKGLTIVDIYWLDSGRDPTSPTGISSGPFDDLWDDLNEGDKYSDENVKACLEESLTKVGGVIAAVSGTAGFFGVTGKAVISFVGGPVVLTVSGVIAIGAFMYWSHSMEECLVERQRQKGEGCHITMTIEQDCKENIEQGGAMANPWCHRYLINLLADKWDHLEARLGADTLQLVVDPAFNTDNLN